MTMDSSVKTKKQTSEKQEETQIKERSALTACRKEVDELKTKFLRVLADYQNLEKRSIEEKARIIQFANKEFILKLLVFLDDLNRAELFLKDESLILIKKSFEKMLEQEGLKEIEVLHKAFDPYTAEVIDMVEGENDDMVVGVLRKGYTLHGTLLRPAQVRVSKKAEKKTN